MSYSAEDFFFDSVAPKMAELFKNFDPEKPSENLMEEFKTILENVPDGQGYDKFRRSFLWAMISPYGDNPSVDKAISEVFNMLFEEYSLRKLEYSSDTSVISVDYQALMEGPS